MYNKIKRFLRDVRGSYTTAFALTIIPMIGTAAAALDYSSAMQSRTFLQNALDAAALATAKEIASSSDEEYLKSYARQFFDANLDVRLDPADISFSFQFQQPDSGGSRIVLGAGYRHDTFLAPVIGVRFFDMDVTSVVAAGNRTAEIAIVIDNSGSMNSETGNTGMSRLEAAQLAAANLIQELHSVASLSNKDDPIKVAIVPFASSVNVGPQFRGADWLDMNGWSSVHHENLDWIGDDTNGDSWEDAVEYGGGFKSGTTLTVSIGPNPPDPLPPDVSSYSSNWLTRWTLFDALGVDWAGCVEMRPSGYHATDTAPDSLDPDTLFVPMFAPDEPDYEYYEDNDYGNNYLSDYRRPGDDYPAESWNQGSYDKQHRRQFWTAKYNTDAIWTSWETQYYHRDRLGSTRSRDLGKWGPNQGCTTNPIHPLTTSESSSKAAVAGLSAGGFTNVQAGIAWGWRALSPGSPFTEGRAYTVPENDKYIIVLTDGNNTYPNQYTRNETEYYPWGYGREDRVRDGLTTWMDNVDAMNAQTARTCENIKQIMDADNEQAYRIFTIAYDVPNGSSVKSLLYNCATTDRKGRKYYYDVEGAAIADAMAAIGNEISELRIAQ